MSDSSRSARVGMQVVDQHTNPYAASRRFAKGSQQHRTRRVAVQHESLEVERVLGLQSQLNQRLVRSRTDRQQPEPRRMCLLRQSIACGGREASLARGTDRESRRRIDCAPRRQACAARQRDQHQ